MTTIPISSIIIGNRFRKELGDVDKLAASIADIGLLHPIVITPDNRLIAGARRIEAHKRLGLTHIEATIIRNGDKMDVSDIENIGESCAVCGYPFADEHHVLPKKYNGNDSPDNKVSLCPTHHRVIHFLLRIDIILRDDKKRARFNRMSQKQGNHIMAKYTYILRCDQEVYSYYKNVIIPMLDRQVQNGH